jgi:hypothetical protein
LGKTRESIGVHPPLIEFVEFVPVARALPPHAHVNDDVLVRQN